MVLLNLKFNLQEIGKRKCNYYIRLTSKINYKSLRANSVQLWKNVEFIH